MAPPEEVGLSVEASFRGAAFGEEHEVEIARDVVEVGGDERGRRWTRSAAHPHCGAQGSHSDRHDLLRGQSGDRPEERRRPHLRLRGLRREDPRGHRRPWRLGRLRRGRQDHLRRRPRSRCHPRHHRRRRQRQRTGRSGRRQYPQHLGLALPHPPHRRRPCPDPGRAPHSHGRDLRLDPQRRPQDRYRRPVPHRRGGRRLHSARVPGDDRKDHPRAPIDEERRLTAARTRARDHRAGRPRTSRWPPGGRRR